MSFSLFSHDVEEITRLLVLSHASSGKSVCVSRHGQVFVNLSAKSTINEWHPRNKIIQTALLDLVGDGDGGKLGVFIFTSLFRSILKLHPDDQISALRELEKYTLDIEPFTHISEKHHLVQLTDEDYAGVLADAALMSGASSHISLEKYEGTGVELVETDSFISEARPLYLPSEQVSLKGPLCAFFPYAISEFSQIEEALSLMGSFEGRPLVIFAPMLRGQALATIKLNREEGIVEAYGVEAPLVSWGKGWLEDVASFTGGSVHNPTLHQEFQISSFGSAKEILLRENEIIIDPYDDHAEITAQRISTLLREAEETPHTHTQDLWRKRAASLGGTLIRLKIGGDTEAEARLRRNRAEKHLISMSSMVKGGHVEGAIPTLAKMARGGEGIIERALRAPLKVVGFNRNETDLNKLARDSYLTTPFPSERLFSLVSRSMSLAVLICSVGGIVRSRK